MSRFITIAVAVAVFAAVAGGVAYATIPDSSGVIQRAQSKGATFRKTVPMGSAFAPVTLARVGPFTFKGRCWQYNNGDPNAPANAQIEVSTTQPGHIFTGGDLRYDSVDPFGADVSTDDGYVLPGAGYRVLAVQRGGSGPLNYTARLSKADFTVTSSDRKTNVFGLVAASVYVGGASGSVCALSGRSMASRCIALGQESRACLSDRHPSIPRLGGRDTEDPLVQPLPVRGDRTLSSTETDRPGADHRVQPVVNAP
jgi:hypothetical protein